MAEAAAKFCGQCGAATAAGARFCAQCGASLAPGPAAPAPAPRSERRQAVILFADLSGFTALSSELDPEDVHALLARYFAVADEAVRAAGGFVDKHIGDAVMAVFGAPVSHGNDAERAVRAALDIVSGTARLGNELGRALTAHVGIASGEIMAGATGSATHSAYTVTGAAANLAARLLDQAKAGEIVVSARVAEVVAHRFAIADRGQVSVKGFDAPIGVGAITGEIGNQAMMALVGRESEMSQIEALLAASLEHGGRVVCLRGEPGIGKTRLMAEIVTRARARGTKTHSALALDFGAERGGDPIRVFAAGLLGLDGVADETTRADALTAANLPAVTSLFVRALLDLPMAGEQSTWEAMTVAAREAGRRDALAALVARAAAEAPLLLAVEDVHWADAGLRDRLAALARALRDIRASLLLTTRVEGDPIDAGWRAQAGVPVATIDLGPLAPAAATLLARAVLSATDDEGWIARADGNPLFVIQLARARAEASDDVPDSIQSVVQARLDRLDPTDRATLQCAAVIGQHFALATLEHLAGRPADCARLIAAGLVRPEGDHLMFVHALIRDGVYSTLLRARRGELHRRAAQWFAERDDVLAARHLDRAKDDAAPDAYLRAAKAAEARYEHDAALDLLARGIDIAPTAKQPPLMAARAELLLDMGRAADAEPAWREILASAPDRAMNARAWIGLAACLRVLSRVDEALMALREAEAVLTGEAARAERTRIHYLRGNLHFTRGEAEACRVEHEAALALARANGDLEYEARALNGLGDACYAIGRMRTARDHFQACTDLCQRLGFGRIELSCRFMLAHCAIFLDESDRHIAGLKDGADQAARTGNRFTEMICHQTLVSVFGNLDRYADVLEEAETALSLSRKIGSRRFDAMIMADQARALSNFGRIDEALRLVDEAVAITRETGTAFVGPAVLGVRAAIAADEATAVASMSEARVLLQGPCIGHNPLYFFRHAMATNLKWRRWIDALADADALERFTAPEPLPWATRLVAETRARVAAAQSA